MSETSSKASRCHTTHSSSIDNTLLIDRIQWPCQRPDKGINSAALLVC